MKTKTIKSVLSKKFKEWLESIEDATVREKAEKNTMITGGCIASMLLKEQVNDFDLYFRNKDTALAVANYYMERFKPQNKAGIECKMWVEDHGDRVKIVVKSAGIASEEGTTQAYEYFEAKSGTEAETYVDAVMQDPGEIHDTAEEMKDTIAKQEEDGGAKYRPVFVSTNAITLSHKIQIVLRFFGEPDEIHENYDFVHCTNYWQGWDGELVLRTAALECLLSKELRYVGSRYPICSVFRLRKFMGRGWTINAGQILKMIMQIGELDLKDINVLQDQLTGVDCAYFVEVITKLKEKDPTRVNTAYLVEILDRMF